MSEGVRRARARRGAGPKPKRSALARYQSLKSKVMQRSCLARDEIYWRKGSLAVPKSSRKAI